MAIHAPQMDAVTTVQCLRRLLAAIREGPILMLWDRVSWYRGAPVRAVLEEKPRLKVTFLLAAAHT